MKNLFKINPQKDSRALLIGLILLLIIGFIANLFGCGNDNPVNNGNQNPVETTVLSFDSVSLRSDIPLEIDSVFLINFSAIDSGKITFDMKSNFPASSNLTAAIHSLSTDTSFTDLLWSMPGGQNQNESFAVGFSSNDTHDRIKIYLRYSLNGPPIYTFISISNFKLIKIR